MDIHTKTDSETKLQLVVIYLTELENKVSNLSARLSILENQKLPQEMQIIVADLKDLKKRFLEAMFMIEKKNETLKKIKKINK